MRSQAILKTESELSMPLSQRPMAQFADSLKHAGLYNFDNEVDTLWCHNCSNNNLANTLPLRLNNDIFDIMCIGLYYGTSDEAVL